MRVRSALTIATFAAAAALAGPALAAGDAAKGEKVFNKCKACHTVEEGKNKVGPSLYDVIGRAPASVEGFSYSKAMEEFAAGHVWDEATLSSYLESPRGVVKGTKMAFVGLKKEEDRADVIAYLQQFSQ
ncbi:MAG TPA: cytochrome c family protein [Kiloniellaceae bacterium]